MKNKIIDRNQRVRTEIRLHSGVKRSIHVSLAETDEQKRIAYRLRHQVMVKELGYELPGIDEQTGFTESADKNSKIYIAWDGDSPVGSISLDCWENVDLDPKKIRDLHLDEFAKAFSRNSVFIIRKAVILPQYRTSLVFWKMILKMADYVLRLPAPHFIFLDCAPALSRFYQRLGFRSYAANFKYKTGDLSVPMCAAMNDLEYLKASKSPMHAIARNYHLPHLPEVRQFFTKN